MRARDFMTARVLTLKPDMDVMDAMDLFVTQRISGAPVVDDRGSLVGMLTEQDCLKTVVQSSYHGSTVAGRVHEYMTREVETLDADVGLLEVAELLLDSQYRRYPVMDQNRVVGLISRRDVLRALLKIGA